MSNQIYDCKKCKKQYFSDDGDMLCTFCKFDVFRKNMEKKCLFCDKYGFINDNTVCLDCVNKQKYQNVIVKKNFNFSSNSLLKFKNSKIRSNLLKKLIKFNKKNTN
jgi:hypothetical protein